MSSISAIPHVLAYTLAPFALMVVGGTSALFVKPSDKVTSATQHFAAGVVFAAVAIELLPNIVHAKDPISLVIGFMLGLGVMLFVRIFAEHDDSNKLSAEFPWGMMIGVAVDLFIDGILISIAFAAGQRDGVLVAIALAMEVLFLGLSTSSTIIKAQFSSKTVVISTLVLAPMLLLGAFTGASIIHVLPANWLNGLLAFGVSALLFLVTEELLVEAHEVHETPWITSAFFIGFLCILLLDTQF